MLDKLYTLLNYLNIPIQYNIYLNNRKVSPSYDIELTEENKNWIKEYYKDDFELWNNLNNNPDLFKLVI